ncbi:MAG: hypothetical protein ACI9VR_001624 [Cognaticolwellia sp.]
MERINATGGILAISCVGLTTAVLSVVLRTGEDRLPGLLLLLAEPLLWTLLGCVVVLGVRRRQLLVGGAGALCWVVLVWCLRTPAPAEAVDLSLPGPSPTVRACVGHAQTPEGPVLACALWTCSFSAALST